MSQDYLNTIARLEPEIATIDTAAGVASIAISLKRIADYNERQEARAAHLYRHGKMPDPEIYPDLWRVT